MTPVDVVKSNTKEAFDYFFAQDEFLAREYFTPGRMTFYDEVAAYAAAMLKEHASDAPAAVADIGCGTGHTLAAVRRQLGDEPRVRWFGLDFAASAIAKARTLLPDGEFAVGDLYAIDAPADLFDLVMCIETLEHLQRPADALREIVRICRPGGRCLITVPDGEKDTFDGHVNFWSLAQFAELLRPFGLDGIRRFARDTVILATLVKPHATSA